MPALMIRAPALCCRVLKATPVPSLNQPHPRVTHAPRTRTVSHCTAAQAPVTIVDVLYSCGLKPYQMDRVLRELERSEATNSAAWLSERVGLVKAALGPDAGPLLAEALYNGGVEMLSQACRDLSAFPAQIVKLKEALGGAEVGSIVSKEPRLLWMADASTQIPKVLTKLTQIYPYKSKDKKAEVIKVVQEYPELLVRLGYFINDPKIKTVQDLPVDLQNRILKNYC